MEGNDGWQTQSTSVSLGTSAAVVVACGSLQLVALLDLVSGGGCWSQTTFAFFIEDHYNVSFISY